MARSKKEDNGFPIDAKDIKEEQDNLRATEAPPQVKGSILIKPTVGRMILFHDGFSDQPCAAQIAYVHDDHNINIGYIDQNGMTQSKVNVHLVQDKNITCDIGDCEWMEYQITNK